MRFEMSRIVMKKIFHFLKILSFYDFARFANQNSRIYSPVRFRGINDYKESHNRPLGLGQPLASRSISSKIPNSLGRPPPKLILSC